MLIFIIIAGYLFLSFFFNLWLWFEKLWRLFATIDQLTKSNISWNRSEKGIITLRCNIFLICRSCDYLNRRYSRLLNLNIDPIIWLFVLLFYHFFINLSKLRCITGSFRSGSCHSLLFLYTNFLFIDLLS